MIRPTLEVADVIRAQGEGFIARTRSWLTWPQRKVLHAIARCRKSANAATFASGLNAGAGLDSDGAKSNEVQFTIHCNGG